jgi:hypothetical protein
MLYAQCGKRRFWLAFAPMRHCQMEMEIETGSRDEELKVAQLPVALYD